MFTRFVRKWHKVHWSCGRRHVCLSIHFDKRAGRGGGRPRVERLPAAAAPDVTREFPPHGFPPHGEPPDGEPPPDEDRVVADVLAAVEEFNQRNRTAVRVAAIRYRADDTTGHREATRKLLNRL